MYTYDPPLAQRILHSHIDIDEKRPTENFVFPRWRGCVWRRGSWAHSSRAAAPTWTIVSRYSKTYRESSRARSSTGAPQPVV